MNYLGTPVATLKSCIDYVMDHKIMYAQKEENFRESDLAVHMFPQTWGDTSLGFGGIGGQSITSAYTVCIEGPYGDVAVFFSGRFAYHVKAPTLSMYEDMARNCVKARGASLQYERKEREASKKIDE